MKILKVLLIIYITFIFNLNESHAVSNDKFKFLISFSNWLPQKNPIFIKVGNDNYFIFRDNSRISVIYNYNTNSYSLIDSIDFYKFLWSGNLELFSGVNADGKVIISGIENNRICLISNNNGAWGKWEKTYLNTEDSLLFWYSFILLDPNYKNQLYVIAADTSNIIHFFVSINNGKNFTLKKGFNIPGMLLYLRYNINPYKVVNTNIIYSATYYNFYRINLNKNTIDTTKIIGKELLDSNYFINDFYFENEKNGVIVLKGPRFVEGMTAYQKAVYLTTNDSGFTWQRKSETKAWPASTYIANVRGNYVLTFDDNSNIFESFDFCNSWVIDPADRKKQTDLPFTILSYYPISHRKFLIYANGDELWELNMDINSVSFDTLQFDYIRLIDNILLVSELCHHPANYSIYNYYGSVVKFGVYQSQINISDLPSGVYFFKSENYDRPIKFIKAY